MSKQDEGWKSLQDRVNSLLRGSSYNPRVFVLKSGRDEIALHEYLLEKAERELRAAQINVDELRQELTKLRKCS